MSAYKNLAAATRELLDQIDQMRGMFNDDDGSIAQAIEDAEEALAADDQIQQAIDALRCEGEYQHLTSSADQIDAALSILAATVEGGVAYCDDPRVTIINNDIHNLEYTPGPAKS